MKLSSSIATLILAAVSPVVVEGAKAKMDRLMEMKTHDWDVAEASGAFSGNKLYKSLFNFVPCKNGYAGEYRCNNVNIHGFLSHEDTGSEDLRGNDVWGWVSPLGREFGIVGQRDGVAFVEINKLTGSLKYIGRLPTQTPDDVVSWRDIKVIGDYAYIGSEAEGHGVQIFHLRKLEKIRIGRWNPFFKPKVFSTEKDIKLFTGVGATHNLVADWDRGIIYGVGGRSGPNARNTTCAGGLFVIDPEAESPTCVGDDGYVHDAQCVVYDGPTEQYNGHNICFGYNEDTLTIYDVTDLENPQVISRTPYVGNAYTHQGWLTTEKNMRWILLDDELDERDQVGPPTGNNRTTTYIFNISDLENPINTGYYQSTEKSIDHNQYVVKGLSYQSNYGAGLRVLDVSGLDYDPAGGNIAETGFFDCHPEDDDVGGVVEFLGTWSNYPYFPSGYILLNSIERGVFSLRYNGRKAKY
ncbi:hypothetical protein MBLNU230_g7602t1 [Neophaeotheca triangularis]